uniref:Peptidase M48 domain-containing protein n=1 Tax=Lotharella oceanica TaxID=641309 RepID=A0A7S2U3T5_9EUKA|mmetsp:Transcript_6093/g.12203  ORF Transcript_6093/g.12203 Transcript_6093/m.12203 type:complete len:177 (+) Transcript_6093:237-767(+)
MGHEMSHALLRHGGERISKSQMVLFAQSALSFVVWALVPDGVFEFLHIRAILGLEGLQQSILNIMLSLPNTRAQETEADYLGLLLSSAACYDPRQAPVLWEKFAAMKEAKGQEPPEILSTHPHSNKRAENLIGWQKDAYEMRTMCKCGPLVKHGQESQHYFTFSRFLGSNNETPNE